MKYKKKEISKDGMTKEKKRFFDEKAADEEYSDRFDDDFEDDYDEDYDDYDLDEFDEDDEDEELSDADKAALREVIETASQQCRARKRKKKPDPLSLVGKCLVHIGETNNELYRQAVIYVTESTAEVVRGIMINKLLFGTATLECKTKGNETVLKNVYEDLYQGGPVSPANGVVIFPTDEDTVNDPFADILGDISISSSFGVLQEILEGDGPSKKIIAMGHCVWHKGELEWEIFNNQWLIIPSSSKLMFDTKFEDRWELAKKESGVYQGAFIPQIGLA